MSSVAAPVRPRFRSAPSAVGNEAPLAIELAAEAGLDLFDWQQDVVRDALGVRADGQWSSRVVTLVCPRQNGKGAILEALELFWLFIAEDKLIVHTAHRFDVAQEHFLRVRALIEQTPSLMKRVKAIRTANGSEGIFLHDGSRLLFKARSKGSLRGPSPDKIVLDEAYYLWDEALSGVLPSQGATPNPQTIYTSSSPIPGAESDVLRRLCARGREGDPSMAYTEFSCSEGASLDDRANWYLANPSLGYLLSEESLASDRAVMTDEGFAAEHLGIWATTDKVPGAVPMDAWRACAVDHAPVDWLADPVAFGVDGTGDNSAVSVVAAGLTAEWKVGLDLARHEAGTDWLLEWAIAANETHKPRAFVFDPKSSTADLFLAKFRDAGLPVVECGFTDRALPQATHGLLDDIVNDRIEHLADELLTSAADGAGKRIYGESWLWDRRKPGTVMSPLVAATLARWGLLLPEVKAQPFVFYS